MVVVSLFVFFFYSLSFFLSSSRHGLGLRPGVALAAPAARRGRCRRGRGPPAGLQRETARGVLHDEFRKLSQGERELEWVFSMDNDVFFAALFFPLAARLLAFVAALCHQAL